MNSLFYNQNSDHLDLLNEASKNNDIYHAKLASVSNLDFLKRGDPLQGIAQAKQSYLKKI